MTPQEQELIKSIALTKAQRVNEQFDIMTKLYPVPFRGTPHEERSLLFWKTFCGAIRYKVGPLKDEKPRKKR